MSDTQKLSCNTQPNTMMFTNDEKNKHQELRQKCGKEYDEVLEIKQIEFEQCLIIKRMVQLELQKERLKGILNALQSLDSEDDGDDDQCVQTQQR
ncbi:unnamed protein product [Rotaria sp. Silwood2]|nr:unnamed protein product [Rotaria sp. Silwood2]CAF2560924.1 unnamed protein product [Rotaria sp. Silwood2]CAF2974456.1 unnamed protein product [Rotaria sp. Silwood2]CAF4189063.1 unnamed protein product [Rotaria sp. Silwood2]CAF4197271.1 unnamed protein product [Rotaria sp. Silwood2]